MDAQGGVVLVVDDDRMNRVMLSSLLEREGHRVFTAEDGRRALAMMQERRFDIVLLDIVMPEMDGYHVLEHIKRDPRLQHIPVIMISALDEMETVARCIEMGADDHLPKPFDPVLLRARINAGLTKKRLHDLQLEYLEQVGHVVDAAAALERGSFDAASLEVVAAREDALGQLARVFLRMAREVHEREQRLRRQVQELRTRATRTFMFTDIVKATNLIEVIGDDAWDDLVAWHDKTLRSLFAADGGEEVDHAGDGFFVAFEDPAKAIECAVSIQRTLADHRRTHGFAPQVRVGVHAAEAVRGDDGAFRGKGVHEAARVAALAAGGQILVSERALVAAGGGFSTSEPQAVELKGLAEPIYVAAVDWRQDSSP